MTAVFLSSQFELHISFLKKPNIPCLYRQQVFSNAIFTQIYSILLPWQRKSLIYQNALNSQQPGLLSI